MVEADLRLVVLVVVRTGLLAVFTNTVGRVVLTFVHTARHVLRYTVPLSEGQRAVRSGRTCPVPLRCTEARQTQLVVLVDTLGDIREIAVTFKSRSLDITVTPGTATHDGDSPTFDHAGRNGEGHFIIAVITHGIAQESAFLGVNTFGHDVDRTADRRSGELGCTHTALGLHDGGDVSQTLPVGPIDRTAFHVVHRHTVDHRCYVRVVETTHPDLRVTPTATLAVSVYTRRVLEHLRELLSGDTLFDLQRRHLAYCHRRLLRTSHLTGDRDVLQGDSLRIHADDTHVSFLRFHRLRLVTDIRELQLSTVLHANGEVTVQIGDDSVGSAFLQDRHAYQRLAGLSINHTTAHFLCLREQTDRCE